MAPRRIQNDPTRRNDGVRKGRGLAKQTKKWGKEKLNVLFNEYGQPCGGECAKLATQLGYFAKNGENFPLNVEWSEISPTILDNIWKDIQENTNAPPEYKKICFTNLAKQWRDWKCNVKAQWYNKYGTDEERLANRPDSVKIEQLPLLIAEWSSERSKEISNTNKINRSKQEFPNRTGKVSHSQYRKKLEDEGKPIDRASVFIATRTERASQPVDLTTERMIQTLTDAIEELPEEEQSSPTKREQIFTNLLGKDGHGRLRCMGQGLTKAMVFGKASTGESVAAVRAEMESQKISMQAEMESQRIFMQAKLDAQKKSFEDFQRNLMQQLEGKLGFVLQPMEEHDSNE